MTTRPSDLQSRVVARLREAMEYRRFTAGEPAGAADRPATLLARRLVEPARLTLEDAEDITRACQVPVLFMFDGL